MVTLLTRTQYIAILQHHGFVAQTLKDEEFGLQTWVYNGEVCLPPGPHKDGNGEEYCPIALDFFIKKMQGSQDNTEETVNHSIKKFRVREE